jgi:hypothetical protein
MEKVEVETTSTEPFNRQPFLRRNLPESKLEPLSLGDLLGSRFLHPW